jgi:hypothetical protein
LREKIVTFTLTTNIVKVKSLFPAIPQIEAGPLASAITGHIENVRSIDLNITSMLRSGETAAAAAAGLKNLTEAIAESTEVSAEKKERSLTK